MRRRARNLRRARPISAAPAPISAGLSGAELCALCAQARRAARLEEGAARLPQGGSIKGKHVWKLEGQLQQNEGRISALCQALETQRRDAAPRCKDGYYGERPALLAGRKTMFLDARNVMNLNRGSGVSVVWPRESKGTERYKGHR